MDQTVADRIEKFALSLPDSHIGVRGILLTLVADLKSGNREGLDAWYRFAQRRNAVGLARVNALITDAEQLLQEWPVDLEQA